MPLPRYIRQPQIIDHLCEALRGGAARMSAAAAAGIAWETLESWIDKDPEVRRRVEEAESWARAIDAQPLAVAPPKPRRADPSDRWAQIREEAAALGPGLFGLLLWAEGRFQAAGFPPLSPWWTFAFESFYASGKHEFLCRVGRGGGKSTTLCRPTTIECLFGEHMINPGEVAIWPLLSVDMDEANLKVGILEQALAALGVKGDDVKKFTRQLGRTRLCFADIEGRSLEIRVYPATVTAVSGPTLAGATHDEEAKWKSDKDKGTNSAEEVLDAIKPAFRGRLHLHHFRCSSAYLTRGPHYEDVEAGDTATRHVARIGEAFLEQVKADFERIAAAEKNPLDAAEIRAYAASLTADSPNIPTWLANPTISAEATRAMARNVRVWLREYGSRSSSGEDEGAFFDPALLDLAEKLIPRARRGECFAALDTASRKNACALAIVRRVELKNGWQFPPVVLREWIPTPGRPLDLRMQVLPEAARICRAYGVELWITDAHALTDVEIVGAEHGIATRCRAEGDAYEAEYRPVRDALHRGECPLAGCEGAATLVRQLRGVRSALGPGGHTRILHPEEGELHGDLQRAYVSAAAEAGAGTLRADEEDEDEGLFLSLPSRYAEA